MAWDIPGGKKDAGILRAKPNIKWSEDRSKEPMQDDPVPLVLERRQVPRWRRIG